MIELLKSSKSPSRLSAKARRALKGYFFISPFLIGLVLFYIKAIINSISYSFSSLDANLEKYPVGWSNYRYVTQVDPDFLREMFESLGSLLVSMIVIVLFSIFISNVLNRNMPGKGLFRAILFLPVIISTGIIDKVQSMDILNTMASTSSGSAGANLFGNLAIENYILAMNVNTQLTSIIVDAVANIYSIISRSGVQTVIFLAGLQTISPSLYECARVEGATAWESFWKITIPMISPLIAVNVIYTVIDSFTNAQNPVMEKVLYYQLENINYGLASAMSWMYFILIGIILVVVLAVLSKMTFYENK